MVQLASINKVLRLFGLVLVVSFDTDDGPTLLWLEKSSKYDARTRETN